MKVFKPYHEYEKEEVRNVVTIDIDNLEKEIHETSIVSYDFRMFLAYSTYEWSKAKIQMQRAKKKKSLEIWDDPTEYSLFAPNLKEKIEATVDSDEEIQKMEDDVLQKELVVNKIKAAVEGLSDKRYGISHAIKLFLANYYADNPQNKKALEEPFEYDNHYEQLAKTMRERKKEDEI